MQFKIKMMGGTDYSVNEKEANAAIQAMKNGGVVDLKFALINAKSIEAIENLDEVRLRSNPIYNDEDFLGWMHGNMHKLDALNNRYPLSKYEDEWREVKKIKSEIENGERKLLEEPK